MVSHHPEELGYHIACGKENIEKQGGSFIPSKTNVSVWNYFNKV